MQNTFRWSWINLFPQMILKMLLLINYWIHFIVLFVQSMVTHEKNHVPAKKFLSFVEDEMLLFAKGKVTEVAIKLEDRSCLLYVSYGTGFRYTLSKFVQNWDKIKN